MKEYTITENHEKEIVFSFIFDKTSTFASGLFSLMLFGVIFFKIDYETFVSVWGYIIILICLLFYLTFNKYFEWKKNKLTKLMLDNDNVIINDKFYSKIELIKSVNIAYSVNKFELGWTVYIKKHREIDNYIIKKRLKEEDAQEIAEKLSTFLNKNVVID